MQKELLAATTAVSIFFVTTAVLSAGTSVPEATGSEPVAVEPLHNAFCRALAPDGWSVIDQDDHGATYSVASRDRGMIAAYGIVGISGAQAAGYYGPQFRRPAAFAQYLAETVAGEPIGVIAGHPSGDVTAIEFKGNTKQGVVLFRTYARPDDPKGYIVSTRIAIGSSEKELTTARAVAASIDCNTTYKPPVNNQDQANFIKASTGEQAK